MKRSPMARLIDARRNTNISPTTNQQDAGNYKKGKLAWNGLNIRIENPKGSVRSGVSEDGKEWSIKMKDDYGYFSGRKGKDGDEVDVFIGPNFRENTDKIYIVNQLNSKTKQFDEHKCVVGVKSKEEAKKIYLRNYEANWQGCGKIKEKTIDEFKAWLNKGNLNKQARVLQLASML